MDPLHKTDRIVPPDTKANEVPVTASAEPYADLTAAEEAAIRRIWAREEVIRRGVGMRALFPFVEPVDPAGDDFVHTLKHLRVHYEGDNT